MAVVLPSIPKADSLSLHTGNICSWTRLSKKPSQFPNSELIECVESSLKAYFSGAAEEELQYAEEINLTPIECISDKPITPENRAELKLTVKMFLHKEDSSMISSAVKLIQEQLGADVIDSFLISFTQPGEKILDMSKVKVAWEKVEELCDSGAVHLAGVSDFSLEQLSELHSWARVKPTTDQINVASCCEIPPDLVQYSQGNDIQLLTHSDPPEIIKDSALGDILGRSLTPRDAQGWHIDWVVRYSVLIKCRGIIKSKGYLMHAQRKFDDVFQGMH